MPLSTGCALFCLFLLAVGLVTVHMEVDNVRSGVRIRQALEDEQAAVERLRRLQLVHHEKTSPDVLEASLPEEFRTPLGFPDDGRGYFPKPSPDTHEDEAGRRRTP